MGEGHAGDRGDRDRDVVELGFLVGAHIEQAIVFSIMVTALAVSENFLAATLRRFIAKCGGTHTITTTKIVVAIFP
jgi:hypothetical protein